MTLYEFVSDEDMHEAMRKTDHHPHCMPVFYSIRHHLTARFPAGPIRLFGYPSENPSLWFVLRQNIHVKLVYIASSSYKHQFLYRLT
ncbi:unnamed protein product [Toxocara canis]|uniref:PB1 domain-containing protein n=1 Tax=Toxocara canis TaxID=6265 RepID=A0A183U6N3_TOXCA|nr:unnamed protein product [Toxocara canis]